MSYMLSLSLHCIIRKYIYQVQVFQWQWTIILVVRFLSIDICQHSAEPPPSNTNQAVDDTSNCLKGLKVFLMFWLFCVVWCLGLVARFLVLGIALVSVCVLISGVPWFPSSFVAWGENLPQLPLGCEWNFRSKNARSGIPQIGWLETPRESLSFWAWRFHTSNRVSQKWIQWCR